VGLLLRAVFRKGEHTELRIVSTSGCEAEYEDYFQKWRGFLMTKRPKVQGSEKWGVKCSEVKWCEVMILGEMCVLSLIYICAAVYRLCAVRYVIIIWFYLLLYNYWTHFLIFFLRLFSILCILCFLLFLYCFVYCFSFCVVPFLFLYKSTDHYHGVETQLQ